MLKTEVEASWVAAQSDSITHIDTRRIHSGCWVALIAIALVRAWFTRYELMGGDSLSYLDIARAVAARASGRCDPCVLVPGLPGTPFIFLLGYSIPTSTGSPRSSISSMC